jgi:hypothetical protein
VLGIGPHAGEAGTSTFVGRVEGSDAYIAISKDGDKIGGYVCDDGTISDGSRTAGCSMDTLR